MSKFRATYECALQVSKILVGHPDIAAVEIFGSVARYGSGNDLDLILIVPESIAQTFFRETRKRYGKQLWLFWRYGSARARKHASHAAMDSEFRSRIRKIKQLFPELKFDVFLHPADWKDRTEEIERQFPHKDPGFISRIANYSRIIT